MGAPNSLLGRVKVVAAGMATSHNNDRGILLSLLLTLPEWKFSVFESFASRERACVTLTRGHDSQDEGEENRRRATRCLHGAQWWLEEFRGSIQSDIENLIEYLIELCQR